MLVRNPINYDDMTKSKCVEQCLEQKRLLQQIIRYLLPVQRSERNTLSG